MLLSAVGEIKNLYMVGVEILVAKPWGKHIAGERR